MEDIESTLQQQNVGPGNEAGSGEWPHPAAEPQEPAPGSDPIAREIIERERMSATLGSGTESQPGRKADKTAGGSPGPARSAEVATGNEDDIDPPEGFNRVLDEMDPAEAGSRSQADPS